MVCDCIPVPGVETAAWPIAWTSLQVKEPGSLWGVLTALHILLLGMALSLGTQRLSKGQNIPLTPFQYRLSAQNCLLSTRTPIVHFILLRLSSWDPYSHTGPTAKWSLEFFLTKGSVVSSAWCYSNFQAPWRISSQRMVNEALATVEC
jgi:hypothetical protein